MYFTNESWEQFPCEDLGNDTQICGFNQSLEASLHIQREVDVKLGEVENELGGADHEPQILHWVREEQIHR